jgi:hypothetical protein
MQYEQYAQYGQRSVYQSISRAGLKLALSGVAAAVCTAAAVVSWVPLAVGGLAALPAQAALRASRARR